MGIRLIDIDETVAVPFDTPIALVRADERYPLTVFGTQVTYRRLTVAELQRCVQHSRRPHNGTSASRRQRDLELQYVLLDWQGLEDTNGQPVVCPIPVPETILHALPTMVRGAFIDPCQAVWPLDRGPGQAEGLPAGEAPATLTVRRILSHELETLLAEHTHRGDLHRHALSLAVVQHCLKSWAGVYDGGLPVPLDDGASARLPLRAVEQAYTAITAAEVGQRQALANLD